MRAQALALALLCGASPLMGQRLALDPDKNFLSADAFEHMAGGFVLDLTANTLSFNSRAWHRVAVVAAIGAAFELGQADMTRGRHEKGMGFGVKDLVCDVLGALAAETVWRSWKGVVTK